MGRKKLNHARKAAMKRRVWDQLQKEMQRKEAAFIAENGGGEKGKKALERLYDNGGDIY